MEHSVYNIYEIYTVYNIYGTKFRRVVRSGRGKKNRVCWLVVRKSLLYRHFTAHLGWVKTRSERVCWRTGARARAHARTLSVVVDACHWGSVISTTRVQVFNGLFIKINWQLEPQGMCSWRDAWYRAYDTLSHIIRDITCERVLSSLGMFVSLKFLRARYSLFSFIVYDMGMRLCSIG